MKDIVCGVFKLVEQERFACGMKELAENGYKIAK
jgi:hypothetical protein